MDVAEILTDMYSRVRENVDAVLDGIDPDHLTARVEPGANTIAWLVWHLTRVEDDHVADLLDADQIWTTDGWAERLALPLDVGDTGYGHSAEQVGAVRATADDLRGYFTAVRLRTDGLLATLVPDALDRIVDTRWDPPVTLGVRLVSIVDDGAQHIGQATLLRGILERA